MFLHPANYWKVMAGLLFATLGFAMLFLTIPEIDLVVSGWFYTPETDQWAGQKWLWLSLREFVNTCFDLTVIALLVLWAWTLIKGSKSSKIPAWYWGFPLITILTGPGVIANLIFKANWGRARPETVQEFGGELTFSPPFVIEDQCAHNCSFVSGEASSLSTLAMLIAVLIIPHVKNHVRRNWTIFAASLLFWGCFSRIFMGRHFLSDTIFAVLFCAITLWVFWGVFGLGKRQNQCAQTVDLLAVKWANLLNKTKALFLRDPA
jgi:lipid A 4'-phosphatase